MNVVEERPDIVDQNGQLVKQRPRVKTVFSKPSLTRQEFKEECDLAITLKKFGRTPEGRAALANASGFAEGLKFGDVSSVPDFRAARDAVNAANASFMALPPLVRRRFENDPAQFLDFLSNPANLDEARSLGLAKPKAPEPPKVPQEPKA